MVGIIEGSEKIGSKTNCRGLSLILADLDDSLPDMEATEIELIPKGYTTEGFAKKVKFVTDPISFWDI